MKLSIIVPVYNMAADGKLAYCLDSLVAQTVSDYEIIAVDDASTDDSFEVLKEYERKYPDKFKAVKSAENLRQGGAKNIGIRMARGEWIGFIDSDDWITPDMYEKLIAAAEKEEADLAGCKLSQVSEHTYTPGKIVPEESIAAYSGPICGVNSADRSENGDSGNRDQDDEEAVRIGRRLITDGRALVTMIYRRETIIKYDLFFPEHMLYEDNAVGNSYMLTAKKCVLLDEPMYFYYQHGESTVHTFSEERCDNRLEAGRIMINEAKRLGFYDQYKEELEYKFTRLYFVNTLLTYMPCVKPTRLSFVKAMAREMKAYFPDFAKNRYYLERIHPEERKLSEMAVASPLRFYIYYKLLLAYRKLRSK